MPQLERSSKGGKICFSRGQNFWVGLVFVKFSVDIQKKKVIAPIWSTFLRGLGWFPKKKTPFWNCCKGNESLGGYAGQFGVGRLFMGAPAPLAPPP